MHRDAQPATTGAGLPDDILDRLVKEAPDYGEPYATEIPRLVQLLYDQRLRFLALQGALEEADRLAILGRQSCTTCRYCRLADVDTERYWYECHYGPPVFVEGESRWPDVSATSWCGRYVLGMDADERRYEESIHDLLDAEADP